LFFFLALHDELGAKAIGAVLNFLDRQDRRRRINGVRYYTFKELREGLAATLREPKARKAVAMLFEKVMR
jgi:hypothetical protein